MAVTKVDTSSIHSALSRFPLPFERPPVDIMSQRPHTTQPAPSPTHASTHTHHRLFLGPLPDDSGKVNTARVRRYRRIRGREGDDAGLVDDVPTGVWRRIGLRGRRRSDVSDVVTRDSAAAVPYFIIGEEFKDTTQPTEHGSAATPPIVLINPQILSSAAGNEETKARQAPKPVSRPSIYPRTTDRASFQTARSTPLDTPEPIPTGKNVSKSAGTPGTPFTLRTGTTDFFSAKSTIVSPGDDTPLGESDEIEAGASNVAILEASSPLAMSPPPMADPPAADSPRFRTKLRSALRKNATNPSTPTGLAGPEQKGKNRRSVQFPVDSSAASSKGPAPPREVLARTGSAVEGTSAGVVEAATRGKRKVREGGVRVEERGVSLDADDGEVVEDDDQDEEKTVHLRGELECFQVVAAANEFGAT